jgi:cobalamin synthase
MMTAARWLSQTAASTTIRDIDWLIPVLQSVHILAIAMVMSSVLMIDLRVLQLTRGQTMVETVRRFEAWIWSGLAVLAATGAPLIVAEPKRTLPNVSFQLKLVLLVLAAATTAGLCSALRRNRGFHGVSGDPGRVLKLAAVASFLLWCAVAAAGRFIAYTQPI